MALWFVSEPIIVHQLISMRRRLIMVSGQDRVNETGSRWTASGVIWGIIFGQFPRPRGEERGETIQDLTSKGYTLVSDVKKGYKRQSCALIGHYLSIYYYLFDMKEPHGQFYAICSHDHQWPSIKSDARLFNLFRLVNLQSMTHKKSAHLLRPLNYKLLGELISVPITWHLQKQFNSLQDLLSNYS